MNEIGRENAGGSPTQPLPVAAEAGAPKRHWLGIALLCVGLFVSGAVCGGGAAALFINQQVRDAFQHPERVPGREARRLTRALDLDPEQRAQVERILHDRHDAIMKIHREAAPRMRQLFEQSNEQIRAVLRPDQQQKFDHLPATFRERWIRHWMPASQPE